MWRAKTHKDFEYLGEKMRTIFFLSFPKILHSFLYNSCVTFCKDLQKTIVVLSSGPCKHLHLQCNVFVIYDELKAVPQRPSHDKVSQKHALTGEQYFLIWRYEILMKIFMMDLEQYFEDSMGFWATSWYRSSHRRCSIKKAVRKSFALLRGKHLC